MTLDMPVAPRISPVKRFWDVLYACCPGFMTWKFHRASFKIPWLKLNAVPGMT